MGSRERKRSERRKRKARAVERDPSPPAATADGDTVALAEQTLSRSEQQNQAIRDSLEPLAEGQRPRVVTIGAIVSALVSVSVFVAYAAGAEVDGERPHIAQVLASGLIFAAMSWGMWKARYWAVLGFQAVTLIFLVLAALSLAGASDLLDAASYVLVMAISGTFFWFGVKAMARIQMPDRP